MSEQGTSLAYARENDLNEAVVNFRRYVEILRKWDSVKTDSLFFILFLVLALLFRPSEEDLDEWCEELKREAEGCQLYPCIH